MNLLKSLLKGKGMLTAGIWYTIGKFLTHSVTLLSIPIFTRLLSPADFGTVSLYTMWVSIFSLFVGMQVNGSINNAYMDFGKTKIKEYMSSILVLSFFSFILILGITIAFQDQFSILFELNTSLVILVILQSYATFCIVLLSSYYTALQQRYKVIALSALVAITTMTLAILFTWIAPQDSRYFARIYGEALPILVIGIIVLIYILVKGKKVFIKYWQYCLPITLPLILHAVSGLILNQSDRLMLAKFLNTTEVGLYSFSYSLGAYVSTIWGAFNSAWVPWYYQRMRNKETGQIIKIFRIYKALFSTIISIYIFISPEFSLLMGSTAYQQGIYITPVIILGFYFNFLYSFPVNHEFYHKKTLMISLSTLVAAVLNILLNLILIPKLESEGAAIATAVSWFILLLCHERIVKLKFKDFPISSRELYLSGAWITIITVIFYIIVDFWIVRWGLSLVIGILFLYYCFEIRKRAVN